MNTTTDTDTESIIPTTPRTRQLRRQAELVHPVLAQAFRRRACEIEFESWLLGSVAARVPAVA